MPVISVQPGRQVLGTVIRREMGLGAGPFPQRRLAGNAEPRT
jgi:hypothetical protein